ncbi:MAG TPA: LacI family DNA-binding transcriptional regulator [Candidatus Limnocylindrales bacterium]
MEERNPRRPRIADVAREAGVSKTAVSFAFNSPNRLAPKTASRILDVADALGYRPHPVARMLTQRSTHTLGVLTPQALSVIFSNPFFGALSEGIALAAEQEGYALHFISPLRGSLARAMGRAMVDGVIAIGLSARHPEVEQIRAAGLPLVMVDSSAMPDQPGIEIDDEGGARAAAEHLLNLGHTEILVVGVEPPTSGGEVEPEGVMGSRLRGYLGALAARGLHLPPQAICVGPASIEGGIAVMRRAYEDGLRPTAVLAMSDAMAIGVLRAARELGLRVPQDMSVVGFDDIDISQHTNPPLTTVHQPIRQKGESAVRLLLAVVERRDPRPEQIRLETRLIIRGSTGPAPRRRQEVIPARH